MSYQSNYDKGNWKGICDACGRIVKASELQRRWDGFMVDERCWEPRQPQDFVRGVADYQAPPYTRPEQSDSFIPFNFTPLLSYLSNGLVSIITTIIPVPKIIMSIIGASTAMLDVAKRPFFASNNRQLDGAPLNNKPLG
jgi:hypothetical protein